MGLDMYLNGRKFFGRYQEARMEDGYPIDSVEVALGYWRKHPNLHGYIVTQFAEGKDECQEIELDSNNLVQLIAAVQANELPKTEGFFFGASPDISKADEKQAFEDQQKEDLDILGRALGWLTLSHDPVKPFMKSVSYRASW